MTDDPLPPDLADLLQDLPLEIEPQRDLWEGVEAAIEPVPLPDVRRPTRRWPWAVAAVLAATLLAYALVPAPSSPVVDEPTVALLQWEAEVNATTRDLQAVLDANRSTMDPEALAVIEGALADIDAAILDVQRALRTDPGNDALTAALADVWQRKVHLLRSAAELGEAG